MAEEEKEMLGNIVKSCYEKAQEQKKAEGYIKLE
jgi:fatty acid synthase subunit alpha